MFGDQHSYVAASLSNLGGILRLKGEFIEAEKALRQALDIDRALYGERHVAVAFDYGTVAHVRSYSGDGAGAIPLMRQSLALYRELLGDGSLNTIVTLANLAYILAEYGHPVEAESLSRAAWQRLDEEKVEHRTALIT